MTQLCPWLIARRASVHTAAAAAAAPASSAAGAPPSAATAGMEELLDAGVLGLDADVLELLDAVENDDLSSLLADLGGEEPADFGHLLARSPR